MELAGLAPTAGLLWYSSFATLSRRDQRALSVPSLSRSHVPQAVEPWPAHPTSLRGRTGAHDFPTHDRLVRSLFGPPCLAGPVEPPGPSLLRPFCRDPEVKLNNVERLASYAMAVLWLSITQRVITRMRHTFAIKAKANLEWHRIPQSSPRGPWFPLIAWATSSLSASEGEISRIATNEQKPFTCIGHSSSIRYRAVLVRFVFCTDKGAGTDAPPRGWGESKAVCARPCLWLCQGGESSTDLSNQRRWRRLAWLPTYIERTTNFRGFMAHRNAAQELHGNKVRIAWRRETTQTGTIPSQPTRDWTACCSLLFRVPARQPSIRSYRTT